MAVLDHVILKVNSLEESVAFYTRVLGFALEDTDVPFTLLRVGPGCQLQLAPFGGRQVSNTTRSPCPGRNSRPSSLASGRRESPTGRPSIPSAATAAPARSRDARGQARTLYFDDPNRHLLQIRAYDDQPLAPSGDSDRKAPMDIDTCHFEIHVDSLEAAEAFYVGTLGLSVLQRLPPARLLALRAGAVRISVFADATAEPTGPGGRVSARIIFRTHDLNETILRLNAAGIATPDVSEAPGFMKFISLRDPSGNPLEIAEYLRDPMVAI